jgi:hypothetical protein
MFPQILDEGIRPNRVIWNVMACVYEEEADDVCRFMIHIGVDLGGSVQISAMGMYAWYGRVDIARRFFVGILAKD